MSVRNHFPRLLAGTLLATGLFALGTPRAKADDLATIRQRGTLIVGVKADYPPFGFRSSSGEIEGIEPALAADVAKSLGVKLELVPVLLQTVCNSCQQGKIDLIIATMNGTMVRRSAVDIVKPYYYAAGYNIMVPKSMNLKSWAELKGKPVCGIEGAYYNYEATMNFELQVVAFAGTDEALTALQQGRCVGCCMTTPRSRATCSSRSGAITTCRSKSQEVQPWGLAVRMGQPEWAAYMSTMVKKWEKDGTILDLETKYQYQAFEVRRGGAPEGVRVFRQLGHHLHQGDPHCNK